MIAATYARYSSDAQRAASIDDQERNCDAVAERHGWTVEHRYRDRAVSGAVSDRPEYRRMLGDAEAGHFQALLIEISPALAATRSNANRPSAASNTGGSASSPSPTATTPPIRPARARSTARSRT